MIDGVLRNAKPDAFVLHIGPGALYDDIDYASFAGKVAIAEPDPEVAAALSWRFADAANITIHECAVLSQAQDAELHRYNFPLLNSFRSGGELHRLFPGLRCESVTPIRAMSAGEAFSKIVKPGNGNDILVLDALGEDLSLLQAVHSAQQLERFAHVVIRATAEAIFPGAADIRQVEGWLNERGYTQLIRLDNHDPDFPIYSFFRNPLRGELLNAKKSCERLRADLSTQQSAAKEAENLAAKAERDLKTTVRIHAATQSDLRDLQSQYAALRAAKLEQDALLEKVTMRLSDASDYLRRLSAPSDEVRAFAAELFSGNTAGASSANEDTNDDDGGENEPQSGRKDMGTDE